MSREKILHGSFLNTLYTDTSAQHPDAHISNSCPHISEAVVGLWQGIASLFDRFKLNLSRPHWSNTVNRCQYGEQISQHPTCPHVRRNMLRH